MTAPTLALKRAIRSTLRAMAVDSTLRRTLSNPGYIYTAYVSTLTVDALARISGVTVTVQNRFGTIEPFRFPLAPSRIYTSLASWYEIATRKGRWEIHLCCQCEGVSGMLHELDIMLVTNGVAQDCRTRGRNPCREEILFLVECKNVGAVEYGLGREFLGLCLEFPSNLGGAERWTVRENERSGALVASLAPLSRLPSAFQLIRQRRRGAVLIAEPFVEPARMAQVRRFQDQVIDVLEPVLT